jgi:hypothetical protein
VRTGARQEAHRKARPATEAQREDHHNALDGSGLQKYASAGYGSSPNAPQVPQVHQSCVRTDLSTVRQPEIRGEISPRIKCSSLRFKCNGLLYLNRGLPGSAVYDLSTVRQPGWAMFSGQSVYVRPTSSANSVPQIGWGQILRNSFVLQQSAEPGRIGSISKNVGARNRSTTLRRRKSRPAARVAHRPRPQTVRGGFPPLPPILRCR